MGRIAELIIVLYVLARLYMFIGYVDDTAKSYYESYSQYYNSAFAAPLLAAWKVGGAWRSRAPSPSSSAVSFPKARSSDASQCESDEIELMGNELALTHPPGHRAPLPTAPPHSRALACVESYPPAVNNLPATTILVLGMFSVLPHVYAIPIVVGVACNGLLSDFVTEIGRAVWRIVVAATQMGGGG